MTDKRNIAEEDIFLKARLLSKGARIEVKEPPEKMANFHFHLEDTLDAPLLPMIVPAIPERGDPAPS